MAFRTAVVSRDLGADVTPSTSATSTTIAPESNILVLFRSTNGSALNMRPVQVVQPDGHVYYQDNFSIAANSDALFGPFERPEWLINGSGVMALYGATVTNLKDVAIQLPVVGGLAAPVAVAAGSRTLVQPVKCSGKGVAVAWANADAVNGHAMPSTGRTYLLVDNASGAGTDITVSVPRRGSSYGVPFTRVYGPTSGAGVTIPAGKIYVFGPFDPTTYNQSDDQVYFTLSAATSVKVAAFEA